MKNFAKLTLLFSITFLIIFLIATGVKFLGLRVDWAKNLPPKPETSLTLAIAAAHWALSLALFSSVLFSLGYAGRRSYFAPMTIVITMCLSMFFFVGVFLALQNWKSVPPEQSAGIPLGGKGLILSNSLNRNETAVVLLNGTAEPLGPRVTAIPDQPLLFHESVSESFDLPPVPFGDNTPWFLKSLIIDIRLNAEIFQKKFDENFISYLVYVFSLIFLLCSLGYAIKFSAWPLANLFIGVLAFRGILALQTFLSTPEMLEIIDSFLKDSFLKDMIPVSLVTLTLPLIFLGIGALLHLYSFLIFITKRRPDDDY
ncbi:MAG: hypothetical protein LBQ93_11745 [Treponema sp.]|jgi:hypothetical protein|nr:hypothetical protein [Treponema sp.]